MTKHPTNRAERLKLKKKDVRRKKKREAEDVTQDVTVVPNSRAINLEE